MDKQIVNPGFTLEQYRQAAERNTPNTTEALNQVLNHEPEVGRRAEVLANRYTAAQLAGMLIEIQQERLNELANHRMAVRELSRLRDTVKRLQGRGRDGRNV